MVVSSVSGNTYSETYDILKSDDNMSTSIYEIEYVVVNKEQVDMIEMDDPKIKTIQIVLGGEKISKQNENFIIVPIYIVHNGIPVAKIGYYEYSVDEQIAMMDDDSKLEMMKEPLFFDYDGIKRFFNQDEKKIKSNALNDVSNDDDIEIEEEQVQKLNEERSALFKGYTKDDYVSKEFIETVPSISQKLYNKDIVFTFHIKSPDKKPSKPGKGGGGESIKPKYEERFVPLQKIKRWRNMLSDLYHSRFDLDGKRWESVEHYFQGSKYKQTYPMFYELFSLDSNSILSKDPSMAKKVGTSGKFENEKYKIDDDFVSSGRDKIELYRAQYAKFTQSETLRDMIKKTLDAQLLHIVPKQKQNQYPLAENIIVIRQLIIDNKI